MKGARSSVLTATARVDRLEGDRNVAGLIAELGNPLGRGRYRQVRGYAAIALGNIGDPRAAPPLIELATDPSDVVRMNVHEALGKVGAHEAIPVLIDALRDRSVIVRSAAAESFGRLRATQALEPLRTRFR